jgi:transposase
MSRYDLADFEWRVIEPLLPNKPRGVPRVDDRCVLNGIFWVLRSGAPWRDLPERYGPRTTCYNASCDGGRRACGTGWWTPSPSRTTATSR